jgi:hypothetical protein
MCLKGHHNPSGRCNFAGRKQSRLDLGGVMRVVIEHTDATRCATKFETTLCPTESGESACELFGRQALQTVDGVVLRADL